MKKTLLLSSCLIVSMGISFNSYADTTSTTTSTSSTSSLANSNLPESKNRPCLNIAVSCESAGYTLSKKVPGKNIWKNCVKPILAGQTIDGVTASADDIKACKTKKAVHKMKKMQMQTATPSTSATH